MTPTRTALVCMAVLTTGVLAGCGKDAGGSPPARSDARPAATATAAADSAAATAPATAAAVDPCALVSQQDAQQLAGTPLDPAKRVRETCTYSGPVSGPTAQVEVYVGDGAKKQLDIDRTLGHEIRQLSGVGDEAYAEDGAAFVRKAGTWVSIRLVRLNDPAENRQPLENLARTVAGRL
ncbi:DUF3558 family protein [Planosporangium thailandense]|uniref:DUF3558 family protein n=1 Tax=Planosporangium thailandense TaxID=765197 RepID=A0ABX0Y1J5_9ACTN|nr:DUF3558 family protein [Planosporangium thailandense]NJC72226.1 DUF3558 family protein [Planosporangium thailandense]